MKEEWEGYQEAADAIAGSDRMAIGLSCLPNKIRGDLDEVKRLNDLLEEKNKTIIRFKELIEKLFLAAKNL